MSSCKASSTPVDTNLKLGTTTSKSFENPSLYRSLASEHQYLMFTRPDITNVVQQVCLFMHDLRNEHFALHPTRYAYFSLHMFPSSNSTLISYTDVDWGGCSDTRCTTLDYCVFLGDNLIFWSSKHQATLSRFSVEAEY